jgi:hypothetical protein
MVRRAAVIAALLLVSTSLVAGGVVRDGMPGHGGRGTRASEVASGAYVNTGSLALDGTGDYAALPTGITELTGAPNSHEMTLSYWVKRDNNNDALIVSVRAANDASCCHYIADFATNGSNKVYNWYTGNLAGPTGASGAVGTWRHVVMLVDNEGGTYKARVAVDGGTLSAAVNAGATTSSVKPLISCRWTTTAMAAVDTCFAGRVDEVSLWSDALSQAEITELYNGGRPGNLLRHSATSRLTHWYPFNGSFNDVVGTAHATAGGDAAISTDVP